MTFLGQHWRLRQWQLQLKSRETERRKAVIFPVMLLGVVSSRRCGPIQKLILSKKCLLEINGWLSGGDIGVCLFYLFFLYLCVCPSYLQPAVSIWCTDLGSVLSSVGGSVQDRCFGFTCPVGDHKPSAADVSINTAQQRKGVAPSKGLEELTWLVLISSFECIFIIADHRSGHSKWCKALCCWSTAGAITAVNRFFCCEQDDMVFVLRDILVLLCHWQKLVLQ